jgi:MFS superfamily sulfate permease-like transporter
MFAAPVDTPAQPRLRFDRHELAGAFGDIGTDLPLIVALIATCGLDAASVCIVFGALQVATGLLYGIPMPVQPLKAMAAIMLAQRLSPEVFAGGGLVIGATMLLLAATGLLDWLARVIPLAVVRGIQLGLGITLAMLAMREYAGSDGAPGYVLAAACVVLLLVLRRQRRVPAPLVVIGAGVLYALLFRVDLTNLTSAVGLGLPVFALPTGDAIVQGALLLALPQLPLSLGNSVVATSQTTHDLFPERAVTVRKIGTTYGLMNLVGPLFGGVPVCHGCGGLVGFHGFGARTGGAPVIYGGLYLVLGLVFAPGLADVVRVFPMPVLGVVLFFEAIALMSLVRDVSADRTALWIALAVSGAVVGLPYGYVVGLVAGTALAWAADRGWVRAPSVAGELEERL